MVPINLRIFTLLAAIFSANYSFAGTVDTAQRMLNQLGYNAGPVDGAYGGKTRAALEQFYEDNGGSFDGKLDTNEVTDLQAAMAERGIVVYVPLNSYDVQRKWTVNPEANDKLYPMPRHSRNVAMDVFWFGPRTKFADFNGDGIDDIVTIGVSAKALKNKDFAGGQQGSRCMGREVSGSDITAPGKNCSGDEFTEKPRIAYGKPEGGYEMSTTTMFIHPPAKSGKIPGYSFGMNALIADYNGDNIPDIFVLDSSFGWDGTYQSLYLSNGDNTWTYSTFSHVKGAQRDFAHGGTTGDIDGDGDIDVVTTRKTGLACYVNNGDGTFRYKGDCYKNPSIVYTISLGDVDGDGDLDAYVGGNTYNGPGGVGKYKSGFYILENNGRGVFRDKVKLPQVDCWVTNPVSEPIDIDNDGDMDFVASFTGDSYLFSAIQIIRNEGNWNFTQEVEQLTDWGDYDAINKEMYQMGYKNDQCGMYVKSRGTVKKFVRETHRMNQFIEQLTFSDVDGDGDKDIVLQVPNMMEGNWKDNKILQGGWLQNRGDHFFQRHGTDGLVKHLRY